MEAPHTSSILFLIPLFPLIGAAVNGLFGVRIQRKYGKTPIHALAIAMPALSFVIAMISVATLVGIEGEHRMLHQHLWHWVVAGSLDADLAFSVDPLTSVMLFVVTFVGTLIHVYSVGYMRTEKPYWRFFAYLNLFMFAMLVLVLGDNFLVMFIGWEGVGLASYLLISFYYWDESKAKGLAPAPSGMKAFVVNRFGDFGFIIGLFLLYWGMQGQWGGDGKYHMSKEGVLVEDLYADAGNAPYGAHVEPKEVPPTSVSFRHVKARVEQLREAEAESLKAAGVQSWEALSPDQQKTATPALEHRTLWGVSLVTLICIFMFVGATGKSAQIPLYTWLPDAMAGPTPVSALIHAATMVTAGVYMVARLNFLFALSPVACAVVATIGAMTAIFAASIGLFQYDIKKVLAYSTVSQLGFMFIAVGVGAYWVGIFHLVTHAFFKACLFLGSGSVIDGCHHEQDMRYMGGLKKYMPKTHLTYLIACIAISGVPPLAGFFSKDEILWKAFDTVLPVPGLNYAIWGMATVAAFFTAFYMFRSYFMTFTGEYRGPRGATHAGAVPHAAPAGLSHSAPSGHGHGHGHAAAAGHGHDAGHGAGHDDAHDDHGGGHHGGPPHETPATMTTVLLVLAGLSVVGGWIGLPHLWHLPNLIEHWLEPVFEASVPFIKSHGHSHGATWGLMFLSVVVGASGIGAAYLMYNEGKSTVPARLMRSANPLLRGVHTLIYNKYFVDELYQTIVVRPSLALGRVFTWIDQNLIDGFLHLVASVTRGFASLDGAIDKYIVDGAVNGVADLALGLGKKARLLQTGSIQNYAYGALAGALVLILVNFLVL